jgi:hypothetical protein
MSRRYPLGVARHRNAARFLLLLKLVAHTDRGADLRVRLVGVTC